MKAGFLFGTLALLMLVGAGSALATTDPTPLINVVEKNVTNLSGCLSASVSGGVSLGEESGIPPKITLGTPTITPPSPSCLVLPVP